MARKKTSDEHGLQEKRSNHSRRAAEDALRRTFRALSSPTAKISIGRLTSLGRGLTRRQFAAAVGVTPDPTDLSDTYVVGLPSSSTRTSKDD